MGEKPLQAKISTGNATTALQPVTMDQLSDFHSNYSQFPTIIYLHILCWIVQIDSAPQMNNHTFR